MVRNIVGGVDAKTYCLFWILIGIIGDLGSWFKILSRLSHEICHYVTSKLHKNLIEVNVILLVIVE